MASAAKCMANHDFVPIVAETVPVERCEDWTSAELKENFQTEAWDLLINCMDYMPHTY